MKKAWIILLGIQLISLCCFFPLFKSNVFHHDDNLHIIDNRRILDWKLENLLDIVTVPSESDPDAFTPVPDIVWFLTTPFARLSKTGFNPNESTENRSEQFRPVTFRVVNLAFYLLTIGLVSLLLFELSQSGVGALLGTLFFALHPLHVEPVLWITGLRDVIAGLSSVVSILFFCRYMKNFRCVDYIISSVTLYLAILSKPTAVVVPFIAVLLSVGLMKKGWREWIRFGPAWVLVLPLMVYLSTLNDNSGGLPAKTVLWERVAVALDSITFYLTKTVFPLFLTIDYGRIPAEVLINKWTIGTSLLPVIVSMVLWFCRKPSIGRVALTGYLVFVAGLTACMGLKPFIHQSFSTVADRYVYLSLLGPALFVTCLTKEWFGTPLFRPFVASLSLFLITLGTLTYIQCQKWETRESLYQYSAKLNSGSRLARGWVVEIDRKKGDQKRVLEGSQAIIDQYSRWNQLPLLSRDPEAQQVAKDFIAEYYIRRAEAYLKLDDSESASKEMKKAMMNYREGQKPAQIIFNLH